MARISTLEQQYADLATEHEKLKRSYNLQTELISVLKARLPDLINSIDKLQILSDEKVCTPEKPEMKAESAEADDAIPQVSRMDSDMSTTTTVCSSTQDDTEADERRTRELMKAMKKIL